MPLFSLLSFSQKGKEGSLAHKFPGGEGEDNGVDQALFKQVFALPENKQQKS